MRWRIDPRRATGGGEFASMALTFIDPAITKAIADTRADIPVFGEALRVED